MARPDEKFMKKSELPRGPPSVMADTPTLGLASTGRSPSRPSRAGSVGGESWQAGRPAVAPPGRALVTGRTVSTMRRIASRSTCRPEPSRLHTPPVTRRAR
jgi:hypothetical protein